MSFSLQNFSLEGRTALVTGATGHLGREMSLALANAGAHVIVNARDTRKGNEVVEQIGSLGGTAELAVFDVTSETETLAFVTQLKSRPIHILVNNAYAGGSGTISESDDCQYRESYEIAVVAAHRLVKSLFGNLVAAAEVKGGASVINIGSMYGLVSPDRRIYESESEVNPPFYGAAKAALIHWTKYSACEFGSQNIRVNAISPGAFPAKSVQLASPEFISKLNSKVPLGRVGVDEEICGAIVFLASGASSYMTGANLVLDGGWTCL